MLAADDLQRARQALARESIGNDDRAQLEKVDETRERHWRALVIEFFQRERRRAGRRRQKGVDVLEHSGELFAPSGPRINRRQIFARRNGGADKELRSEERRVGKE